jgi:hypothetical protein
MKVILVYSELSGSEGTLTRNGLFWANHMPEFTGQLQAMEKGRRIAPAAPSQ